MLLVSEYFFSFFYFFLFFRYFTLSDVWAIGITMYEVITLHHPFENKSNDQVKRLLLSGKYPIIVDDKGYYDAEMIKVIDSMLNVYYSFFFFFFL
jgi:serine/threonine protein kinase